MTNVSLKVSGRVVDRRGDHGPIRRLDQRGLGRGRGRRLQSVRVRLRLLGPAGEDDRAGPVLAEPGIGGVADDRQQPGAGPLHRGAAFQRLQGADAGVLHDVLGVGRVAAEPARQGIGVVEVRQNMLREVPPPCFARHVPPLGRQGVTVILPFIMGCRPQK